ncbi:hypothetical protein GA0074695_4559 [Micromonospora viridifaciens]|uniref:Uncharacterized protein n=1 Tax=Micromonospora viridifaciens TaxID=1881 RepID=A0A1C4YQB6_MICVI|nr:hypothetical protein [Micromonospora viridifaciens]SCF22925.1 hypothetical protein GA0074695_4559 [Micromonospora viridifaciens]
MDQASAGRATQTLAELERLRRRTRIRAHGGAWLPALGIAVLLLGSSALYRHPFAATYSISVDAPYWAGLPDEQRDPLVSYLFWFLCTPLLLAAVGAWYRWRSRSLGLRVAWPLFAGTGLGVLLLLAVLAAVPTQEQQRSDTLNPSLDHFWLAGLLTPLLPIAAAVMALGWAERSRSLTIAGGWIAVLTVWLCGWFPMGYLPGWAADILGGDLTGVMSGSPNSLGGQVALRPGIWLALMALPLVAFAAIRGSQSWRAASGD